MKNVDVNELLTILAKSFNTTVEFLYSVLYKQAIVTGVLNLIWIVLLITGIVLMYRFGWKLYYNVNKEIEEDDSRFPNDWTDYSVQAIVLVLMGIAVIIMGICVCDLVRESVNIFLNPDYYVLKQILDVLK